MRNLSAAFRELFRAFRAVFGAGLFSLGNACGIERAADDVITNAREIAHPAAADQNGAVLVQVVTLAGDVNRTFLLVRQAHPRDFTQSGFLGEVVETERQTPLFCGH
mgnify:CR=1 FL=1